MELSFVHARSESGDDYHYIAQGAFSHSTAELDLQRRIADREFGDEELLYVEHVEIVDTDDYRL